MWLWVYLSFFCSNKFFTNRVLSFGYSVTHLAFVFEFYINHTLVLHLSVCHFFVRTNFSQIVFFHLDIQAHILLLFSSLTLIILKYFICVCVIFFVRTNFSQMVFFHLAIQSHLFLFSSLIVPFQIHNANLWREKLYMQIEFHNA